MPRALSLLIGSALLLGGLLGTANLLLSAESFPLRFLAAYAFFVTAGALWLWHDFLMPILRQDRRGNHERDRRDRGDLGMSAGFDDDGGAGRTRSDCEGADLRGHAARERYEEKTDKGLTGLRSAW